MSEQTATKRIVYHVAVTATMPLATDLDDPNYYTEAVATSVRFRAEMERAFVKLLDRSDYQCDAEVVSFTIEADE